ncbi:copper amine oxidase-like protein [Aneurinibacillus soli]|uniref:Spore cortex-lytic enzyme n=1 Tax=Aneurinibacillus soli TaxID=1500254 RepID=A0A0U4WIR8_9BACL|nr:cell wall hydrolase [Aneurinibacillus soli]PYE61685.1 copper amine oxidase-like protein [Aneurinibacillus soli]BAU28457.1 Spore cortex-lytic enzyme precursor [Aneurinibacillus soli]
MKKRKLSLLLTLSLLTSAAPTVGLAASSAVTINGKTVQTETLMQNDTMLVPARFFMNTGVVVQWSEAYQAVVLTKGNITISLPSQQSYADVLVHPGTTWHRDQLPVVTTDRKDGTYIPLRYAAETLGMTVWYDAESQSASVHTNSSGPVKILESTPSPEAKDPAMHWLYQLTEAEAGGESLQGKIAVAASVLNRVKTPGWPKSVKDVIFEVAHVNGSDYYQYSPVLDKRIYNVTPSQETIKAVNLALHGTDPSKQAVIFYNPEKTANQWVRSREVTTVIGDHVFAK